MNFFEKFSFFLYWFLSFFVFVYKFLKIRRVVWSHVGVNFLQVIGEQARTKNVKALCVLRPVHIG